MKLYLLQGLLQKTNELYTYEVFYKKPTVKDIFEALTGESYDSLSEEERKESLGYMSLTLSDIEIGLLQTDSITTDSHIYYLYSLELNNKDVLPNMDEDIKVLLCGNSDSICIVCAMIGEITENKIPKNDLNNIKKGYSTYDFTDEDEVIEALLSGKEKIVIDDDNLYEWDIVNTKNINKMEE